MIRYARPEELCEELGLPAKPAVVKGEPRSEVNTKGDLGSCSRCSRRRARSSSPRIGPDEPRFALRTWGTPRLIRAEPKKEPLISSTMVCRVDARPKGRRHGG